MSEALPEVYLARHGETAWTISGQHTGRTDLPLTDRGARNAAHLGERLRGLTFSRVLVSPLGRARRTCELAGFSAGAAVVPDLTEWDYGAYEGRRTADIRQERPGWYLFRDGCPGGESVADVGARADRVITRPAGGRRPRPGVRPRPLLPRPGRPVDWFVPRRRVSPADEHGICERPELRPHPG
jgi:broad specificity phosphatase PhoE